MFQELISSYEEILPRKIKRSNDKSKYMSVARKFAEYFDSRGIEAPSDSDIETFGEYLRHEDGKDLSAQTVKNYVSYARTFLTWCVDESKQPVLFTDQQEPDVPQERKTPEQRELPSEKAQQAVKTVRVNFMLASETYEVLALLAVLEHRTLTEILTESVKMYISQHSEQAGILQAAIEQARSKIN